MGDINYMKIMKFVFDNYIFKNNVLSLNYSFDNGMKFEEIIEFPTDKKFTKEELEALDNVFKYIHLAAGISYYKLFCPKEIEIKTFNLSKEEAKFFDNFYYNGLGEFACKNNIYGLTINFPYSDVINKPNPINLKNNYFIPIGGGKDSIVTLEILKKYKKNILVGSVGLVKPIEDTIKISGCRSIHPIRKISPNLLELNKKLDEIGGYNGHVPISGILAFIMAACSIIYGFDTILMSNERSANIGNKVFDGRIVNHQWSKSFEFEKEINSFFKKYVLQNLEYVSFLRPLSELYIAKIFSGLKQYHPVFTSCNKNFRIENRLNHWCCDCDKCRFVFLILAIFMNKNDLIKIFGKNLLNDDSQLIGYKELCGLENYKPFECVGEIEESVYAIQHIDDSFKNDFVVKSLYPVLKDKKIDEDFFDFDDNNLLNEELFNILKEYIYKNIIK